MFKPVLIAALLFCRCADAQMIDVRALSYRGQQAYPQGVAIPPRPKTATSLPVPAKPHPAEAKQPAAAESDNAGNVRQKGLKIFKEEDENKVLNINVDNPEFDKLPDSRKQNILNRISYKET
ncbi:MAG TPA: hypothetical protein DD624_04995 [Alphaproteobacteria bacterium]|nr:hypothetical protein [Alphaproteobacteria bacterium]